MLGLLLLAGAGTLAILAPRSKPARTRTTIYSPHAVGACCGECAAAQAAGTMPYGHTCTPCGAARICPAWSTRKIDGWMRGAAASGTLVPACYEACEAIQPLVNECLQKIYPIDGYGDPIDWSRVQPDGGPLDLLRTRATARMLAGCGAWADMSEAQRWAALGRPTDGGA